VGMHCHLGIYHAVQVTSAGDHSVGGHSKYWRWLQPSVTKKLEFCVLLVPWQLSILTLLVGGTLLC